MAHNIVMPALEMAQENGKLLAWRKKEGEGVAKGEPLLDIETDKAVVEIESPAMEFRRRKGARRRRHPSGPNDCVDRSSG